MTKKHNPPKNHDQHPRPLSVLCVDDDPCISDALSRCLIDYGIQVLRAYDGMQGFWQVLTESPKAVIADLSMPRANGIEMIEWLRRNATTEFLPVIVLTGTDNFGLRRRLRRLNVSAVLEKPASPTEILSALSRIDVFSESVLCGSR